MRILSLLTLAYWLLLTALQWSPPGLASTVVPRVALGSADDLILHFVGYTLLGLLVFACRWRINTYLLASGLAVYALGAETMQAFFPGRCVSVLDVAANLLGIALGMGVGAAACLVTRNGHALRAAGGEAPAPAEGEAGP